MEAGLRVNKGTRGVGQGLPGPETNAPRSPFAHFLPGGLPVGVPGATVTVVLTNDNGTTTLSSAYRYHDLPVLSSLSPVRGPSTGGTTVTLTGTGFLADSASSNSVLFDGVPASAVFTTSDTQITCSTPPGSIGNVSVVVTNQNGSTTLPSSFDFFGAPTLSSIAPVRGPATGGTAVTLTGSGFLAPGAGANEVRFGGTLASSGQDLVVRIWNLEHNYSTPLHGHTDFVSRIAYLPDATSLVSAASK